MPHVDVAGERFFVETAGRGAPLLMVHGFPLDHSMWRAQIDHFAASHQVVAVDLRGFGQSVVTPGKVSMAQLADDCRGGFWCLAGGRDTTVPLVARCVALGCHPGTLARG